MTERGRIDYLDLEFPRNIRGGTTDHVNLVCFHDNKKRSVVANKERYRGSINKNRSRTQKDWTRNCSTSKRIRGKSADSWISNTARRY